MRKYVDFKDIHSLYFKGLEWELEQRIRSDIDGVYSLSPIVVLDTIPSKFEIYIEAVSYKDVKEELRIKDANA